MAIGWKNDSTRPAGRRDFAAEPGVVKREVIRPGSYDDGQGRRDGTPAGMEHTTASTGRYTDAAAIKERNAQRGVGDRGLTGGTFGESNNPTVHSKNTKRYGRDGSKGDFPNSSTGSQPAPLHRGSELAASLPARHASKAGTIKAEVVGHVGGKFKYPSYPNAKAKKHTGHAPGSMLSDDTGALDRGSYSGKYPGAR